MQMWMVWMIWIVFLAVMFGLLADAVSECKGYAKSWFYAGLFLGPIALLILLRKKDPEGQVQYVDTRNAMPQEPRLMRDPATGMMVPSMVTESNPKLVYRSGHQRDVTKLMQIGGELAAIAIILRLITLILSFFSGESEGEGMHIIIGFSSLIILFVTCLLCTEKNKALALGLLPLLLLFISHVVDMSRLVEGGGKAHGFSYGWGEYGWYIVSTVVLLVCYFLLILRAQKSPAASVWDENDMAAGQPVKPRNRVIEWAPFALGIASSLMLVNRVIQGAVNIREYVDMKYANTGLAIWGLLLSTLISCCFYLAYFCIALREGLAREVN